MWANQALLVNWLGHDISLLRDKYAGEIAEFERSEPVVFDDEVEGPVSDDGADEVVGLV